MGGGCVQRGSWEDRGWGGVGIRAPDFNKTEDAGDRSLNWDHMHFGDS